MSTHDMNHLPNDVICAHMWANMLNPRFVIPYRNLFSIKGCGAVDVIARTAALIHRKLLPKPDLSQVFLLHYWINGRSKEDFNVGWKIRPLANNTKQIKRCSLVKEPGGCIFGSVLYDVENINNSKMDLNYDLMVHSKLVEAMSYDDSGAHRILNSLYTNCHLPDVRDSLDADIKMEGFVKSTTIYNQSDIDDADDAFMGMMYVSTGQKCELRAYVKGICDMDTNEFLV